MKTQRQALETCGYLDILLNLNVVQFHFLAINIIANSYVHKVFQSVSRMFSRTFIIKMHAAGNCPGD